MTRVANFQRKVNGAPERIRTSGLQLRRLSLYPAELRAHVLRLSCRACDSLPRTERVNVRVAFLQSLRPVRYSSADSTLPILPSTTRRATALRTFLYVAAVIAVCAASRLPQLQSPNLLADGDECTLGLMAKHVAEGKEFPLFFYGQHYAFSPVEETAGAVAFALFGVGAIPLKAAGLALWTVGIVFFFLALATVIGKARELRGDRRPGAESRLGRVVDEGRRRLPHGVHCGSSPGVAAPSRPGARDGDAVDGRGRADRGDRSGAATVVARAGADCAGGSRVTPPLVVGRHLSVGHRRAHPAGEDRGADRPRGLDGARTRQSSSDRVAVAASRGKSTSISPGRTTCRGRSIRRAASPVCWPWPGAVCWRSRW